MRISRLLTSRVQGLGSARTNHDVPQTQLAAAMAPRCADDGQQQQKVHRIFAGTRIQRRGTVLLARPAAADGQAFDQVYPLPTVDHPHGPSTAARMGWYVQHVLPLAARAANAAMADAKILPKVIRQVVTVSCTGFSAPGLEVRLIERLGLGRDVGRTHIGFMGCHGALNGLRVADALARAVPGEPVLLCCAELCTLHFQYGNNLEDIIANALFADGAAAMVLVAEPGPAHRRRPTLVSQASRVLPDSAHAMTWSIGNHGFRMTLSPQVPRLVQQHLPGMLLPWLRCHGISPGDVAGWAIHPGGPRVIQAVEQALKLDAKAGDPSRAVLAAHGNMSSPTVMFILQRLLEAGVAGPCVMLAFGPGLVVEAALLTLPQA